MAIVQRSPSNLMRLGMGVGLALLAVWVVAFVIMKVTSAAIHLLALAAVVFIAMHAYSWIKHRGHNT